MKRSHLSQPAKPSNPKNPRVFDMDDVGKEQVDQIVCRFCSRNCRKFSCTVYMRKRHWIHNWKVYFKECHFHQIIKKFMTHSGAFSNQNGTGWESINGEKFEDENFHFKHDQKGLLSMASAGPNTNGSQFFSTTVLTPHLDGKHGIWPIKDQVYPWQTTSCHQFQRLRMLWDSMWNQQ